MEWFNVGIQVGANIEKEIADYVNDNEKSLGLLHKMQMDDGSTVYQFYQKWATEVFEDQRILQSKIVAFEFKSENENDTDNAYKIVGVGTEGNVFQFDNWAGQTLFDGLHAHRDVVFPEDFETVETAAKLQMAMRDCDFDVAAETITAELMDENISTYGMFEELCASYIGGNADFRKGLDSALKTITLCSLSEIADKIAKAEQEACA